MRNFNASICELLELVATACVKNADCGADIKAYAGLPLKEKIVFLKKHFEKVVCHLHPIIETQLQNLSSCSTEEEKKKKASYELVYPIIKSIVYSIKKEEGTFTGSVPMFKCFLHDDSTPSMNYIADVHAFYCFGCGEKGKVIDIFNLVDLRSQWRGTGKLTFSQQLGEVSAMLLPDYVSFQEEHNTEPSIKYSNFIPYTKEMNKVRHNPYLHLLDIQSDPLGLNYLQSRGISLKTAKRLAVMTCYPCDTDGVSMGRAYMTFINSNGSYVRRLFRLDKEESEKCPYAANKWWNSKNTGVFNGQVIPYCHHECCFICEGAMDALSVEELGFHAIALNSASNAFHFTDKLEPNVKYICLSDNDEQGRSVAQHFKNYPIFVPSFYAQEDDSILCKYKDINECLVADRKQTLDCLTTLKNQAETFFSEEVSHGE